MMNKLIRIIRSKLRNKNNIKDDWYYERLEICRTCPLNSKNSDPKEKTIRYKILRLLNLNEDFCTVCGCELKAKASEEMEECPEGKWKQIL